MTSNLLTNAKLDIDLSKLEYSHIAHKVSAGMSWSAQGVRAAKRKQFNLTFAAFLMELGAFKQWNKAGPEHNEAAASQPQPQPEQPTLQAPQYSPAHVAAQTRYIINVLEQAAATLHDLPNDLLIVYARAGMRFGHAGYKAEAEQIAQALESFNASMDS